MAHLNCETAQRPTTFSPHQPNVAKVNMKTQIISLWRPVTKDEDPEGFSEGLRVRVGIGAAIWEDDAPHLQNGDAIHFEDADRFPGEGTLTDVTY